MAYVYSPSGRPIHGKYWMESNQKTLTSARYYFSEPTITKDNPAFSMINDSDEDVIYGSDDESRKPLNSSGGKGNDYDSD